METAMTNQAGGHDPWMGLAEAAEYAKCSIDTLARAYKDGELRVTTLTEGKTAPKRLRRSWIDTWLESRATGGES